MEPRASLALHRQRTRKIMSIAARCNADVLILKAFSIRLM